MSRWLPLAAKKDGRANPYCVGLVTHTVTRGDDRTQYLAWRVSEVEGASKLLGGFPTPHAARQACAEDAVAPR